MLLQMDKKTISFSADDWFYLKPECNNSLSDSDKCNTNKIAANNLQTSLNSFGSSMTQYTDSKMLYNRELLFTVNMLVGLAMLCYYVYVNQSVIPSPSNAIAGIGSVSSATSSITDRLSMRPPSQA